MTADILYFNKDCNPNNKAVEDVCSFCKKHYTDFKGLQATTSSGKKAICKDCAKKCAQLIKDSDKPFKVNLDD